MKLTDTIRNFYGVILAMNALTYEDRIINQGIHTTNILNALKENKIAIYYEIYDYSEKKEDNK